MKIYGALSLILVSIILFTLLACSDNKTSSCIPEPEAASPTSHSSGQIYLYGIAKAKKKELDKLFDIITELFC